MASVSYFESVDVLVSPLHPTLREAGHDELTHMGRFTVTLVVCYFSRVQHIVSYVMSISNNDCNAETIGNLKKPDIRLIAGNDTTKTRNFHRIENESSRQILRCICIGMVVHYSRYRPSRFSIHRSFCLRIYVKKSLNVRARSFIIFVFVVFVILVGL